MPTTVYHGCAIWKVARCARYLAGGGWVDVTDTPEHAARYANAQATEVVDPTATTLGEHAAIITIEVDEPVTWLRRPLDHHTLDVCEASIHHGRIVKVEKIECMYENCTCHTFAKEMNRCPEIPPA